MMLHAGIRPSLVDRRQLLDLLIVLENSHSIDREQSSLLRNLGAVLDRLANLPTHHLVKHPLCPPIEDPHIAVISTDLGMSDAVIPSCAAGGGGDDGTLNPM
jgi:hypothetical protein